MINPRYSSAVSLAVLPALVIALAALYSCGAQPVGPGANDPGDLAGSGTIEPGAVGSFLLGAVTDSAVSPGHIEVWANDVAFDSALGIVSFDVRLLNRTQRNIAPPVTFVVTSIVPRDIALVGFDGTSPDGFPFFDFGSKLGGDAVLTPGESTEPVTLRFHTVTARSFAIGFRIDLRGAAGPGIVAGVVYLDRDRDGTRDCDERESAEDCDSLRCESGIAGITVALEKPLAGGDVVTLIVQTDGAGAYSFGGLAEGVYKVFVAAPEDQWEVTSTNPLLVTLVEGPDGSVQSFLRANFGLFPLTVTIAERLFGPIPIGPASRLYGVSLDSTFVNPPSQLTVVYHYYLEVMEPISPIGPWGIPGVVDSASAWINDAQVFAYHRPAPPDTIWRPYLFDRQVIELPASLVRIGENGIRLFTDGDDDAALLWCVYRTP